MPNGGLSWPPDVGHVDFDPSRKNLLLAINLGLNSQQALERALLVARVHQAALHVIHVAAGHYGSAEEDLARQVGAAVAFLEAELSEEFGAGFNATSFKKRRRRSWRKRRRAMRI